MLIEGIHYCVALYEIDADGFPNLIESFIDFHALNEFIRRNNNESYKAKELHYSIVELINGEASACSWTAPMEFTEFSETRIAEEIENFIEDEKDNEELNRKIDAFNKEIHYSHNNGDYLAKRERLKDMAYVCPKCIREVEDCRCACYPYYLVQIDKLMVPIIRELNEKGYQTKGCCAGHPEQEGFVASGIYVAFTENYDFDVDFPSGGAYSFASHLIAYRPNENSSFEARLAFQKKILEELQIWAEDLSEEGIYDWEDEESEDTDF